MMTSLYDPVEQAFKFAPSQRPASWRVSRITLLVVFVGIVHSGCRPTSPEVQPARIVSGSMAPRLYGQHWEVNCGNCGYRFRIGVEHQPLRMQAICPNCAAKNAIEDANIRPGVAVDVQPRDFVQRPPRRWELIAFREPDSDRTAVKRAVGLPGERIAIRNGEVYVDGQWLRKSHAEYTAASVVVYSPTSKGFERWQPETEDSRWRRISEDKDSGDAYYRWKPSEEPDAAFDWLVYCHQRPSAFAHAPKASSRIPDDYEYNQGLTRSLNKVRDVSLTTFIELKDGGEFRVRLFGGDNPLFVELRPNENTVSLIRADEVLTEAPSSTPLGQPVGYSLNVNFVDGQIFVLIDGDITLTYTSSSQEVYSAEDLSLAFGSRGREVLVSEPAILRDIYYLNPHGRPDDWEMEQPLRQGEYFLLGDNAPVSIDSRHWGGVHVSQFVGGVQLRENSTAP